MADPVRAPAKKARAQMLTTLASLPLAATMGVPNISDDEFEREFLLAVTLWLTEYSQRILSIQATAASMASELTTLREQRQAVRAFLGLTDPAGGD